MLLRPERQPQTHGGDELLQNMPRALKARDPGRPHHGWGFMPSLLGEVGPEDSGTMGCAEGKRQAALGWERCMWTGHTLGAHTGHVGSKERGVSTSPTRVQSEED